MPEGIGYGPDAITRLVELATDPTFDVPDPGDIGVVQQGVPQPGAAAPSMDFRVQSFEDGGLVQPQGVPQRVAGVNPGGNNTPVPPQQLDQEAQRLVQEHPEQVLQMKQAIMQALQSGELTMQALNQIVQLATAASQNPQLWPQLRQFAIRQGLASEQDVPQQYDQGLVFLLIFIGKSILSGQGAAPQAQGQPPVPSLRTGGEVPDSRNEDGSVPAVVHEGEFVIPKHVVLAKGTDFFKKMIEPDNGKTKPKAG